LKQIESEAFSQSIIESIVIPQNVEFVDGSAFIKTALKSISVEEGNKYFRVDDNLLVDIVHCKLIHGFDVGHHIVIPHFIKILGSSCFSDCHTFSLISFESPSSLKRIETKAFSDSNLESIVIPCQVEILESECFWHCRSLSSISFESPSSLKQIKRDAFSYSKLESLVIPRNVEFVDGSAFINTPMKSISVEEGNKCFRVDDNLLVDIVHCKLIRGFDVGHHIVIPHFIKILGSSCFSGCETLSSISFESPSSLKRIESYAFSFSKLESISIPRQVEIVGSSCFSYCGSLSRVVFESPSSLKRIGSELFLDSILQCIVIPSSIEILESLSFSGCQALSSIVFQSPSSLKRIESYVFSRSKLKSILIPRHVEILGKSCFSECRSLSSISFESPSSLKQICSQAFRDSGLSVLQLPISICFIESDAVPKECQITLMNGSFSPDFGRFCLSRECNGRVHFKRIVNRVGVYCSLESSVVDLSQFDEATGGKEFSVKRYSRRSDGFQIIVKSFDRLICEIEDEIMAELEMLTRFNDHCIAPLIGIVFPTESTPLKTATPYYCCGSLQDVESRNPVWWTSTTKSKAIAGIALAMKSAHRHGIVHGSLKPTNIVFDENHCVHIVDFASSRFQSKLNDQDEMEEDDSDKELEKAKKADLFSFASILFNILVCPKMNFDSLPFDEEENRRMNNGKLPMIPEFVPIFVRDLIEDLWRHGLFACSGFGFVLHVMKQNSFEFEEGVDVGEVLEFVNSVEAK
jgi:hypothetical protein